MKRNIGTIRGMAAASAQQATTPPGLPPLPDTIPLKRADPTPEQIEAALKARAAQEAAVKERWEKEFAPWLHVAPPKPPEPMPFDREGTIKEMAEKRQAHKEWVAKEATKRGLPLSLKRKGGGTAVLDISDTGDATYYANNSLNAAKTVRADTLWQPTSFNLHGSNVTLGVFEIGNLRPSHYQFTDMAFPSRATNAEVTISNDTLDDNDHATHVAGTLGGYFYNNTNYSGLARGTKLFRLDGETPTTIEYSHRLYGSQLNNLSIGGRAGWSDLHRLFDHGGGNFEAYPLWLGDLRLSTNTSDVFGTYNRPCFLMDLVLSINLPALAVVSAGNNRDPVVQPLFEPIPHVMFADQLPAGVVGAATNNGLVLLTNITHGSNGGASGSDTLISFANSKNALLVGSTCQNPEHTTNAVEVSEFSAFGPTDDGRTKPDIAAPGENMTSGISTGDGNYATYSGTSQATPVVTGGLALVEEFTKRLYGTNHLWNGATYKALAIGTADEMGNAPGPDYRSGYGLFNAQTALNQVYQEQTYGRHATIKEVRLTQGASVQYPVKCPNGGTVTITLVWADAAISNFVTGSVLNRTNSVLVNDLDLRVVRSGVTNLPWVLDPAAPTNAATQGDNWRDNVEQVTITNVTAGEELLVVLTHKGTLTVPARTGGQWATLTTLNTRDETVHPLVLQTLLVNTNELAVSRPARVGSRFELLANDDLGTTNWTAITGEIVALQTNVSVLLTTTNAAQRFLQVRRTQ